MVLLGAQAFWTFWTNQNLIPEVWKGYWVHFDGTLFQLKGDQENLRFVLCLFWDRHEKVWEWALVSTSCIRFKKDLTVVCLKKSPLKRRLLFIIVGVYFL